MLGPILVIVFASGTDRSGIPYLYMPKNNLKTLTTFLMNYANAQQGNWQQLAAAIVIVMIPTILIYIFFQKYIFEGISAGAVKE